jgi:hypothetical protein
MAKSMKVMIGNRGVGEVAFVVAILHIYGIKVACTRVAI